MQVPNLLGMVCALVQLVVNYIFSIFTEEMFDIDGLELV